MIHRFRGKIAHQIVLAGPLTPASPQQRLSGAWVSAAAREKLAKSYPVQDFTESVASEAENAAILKTVGSAAAEDLIAVVETLQAEGKLRPLLILTAFRVRQTGFI